MSLFHFIAHRTQNVPATTSIARPAHTVLPRRSRRSFRASKLFLLVLLGGIFLPLVFAVHAQPATPTVGECTVFPSDNAWNTDISAYPVDPRSNAYIASINQSRSRVLHADFGSEATYGFRFNVVDSAQPMVPIRFTEYGHQSDPGPYPIPQNAGIEPNDDRHVLVVDKGDCKLYELYHAHFNGIGWNAGSGAIFDLRSNLLRRESWTSADAAGLPIFPGLVRYDEAASGVINHALRFTAQITQRGYIHPATHFASPYTNPNLPPMGLRLRLRADYDISHVSGLSHIILQALKTYGMIVADNGTSWFISGSTDPRWDDADLRQLKTIPGTAFEVVQTGDILKFAGQ